MRRRDKYGLRRTELVDLQTVPVDRNGHERLARLPGNLVEKPMTRVLERHSCRAPLGEDSTEQTDRVRSSGGDHDAIRVGNHAACPSQIVRHLEPELPETVLVAVAQVGVRCRGERVAYRSEPHMTRE